MQNVLGHLPLLVRIVDAETTDDVVQQNSVTAEESIATSKEMNGQADLLEGLISQFKIKATLI